MFKIENGREHFYQWDSNQRLIISDGSITEVHYCNRTDSCSLITEVYEENGIYYSNVPNILLQNDLKINVYAFDTDYTKYATKYEVCKRSKPADYVYTETEVLNWETFTAEVEAELAAMREDISAIPKFEIVVVEELPADGVENTIYLVPGDEADTNIYKEYIYINGSFELLGSANVEVDLANYVKKTDYASSTEHGVIAIGAGLKQTTASDGTVKLYIAPASQQQLNTKTAAYNPICARELDYAVKAGITTNALELTEAEKTAAQAWLGGEMIKTIPADEKGEYHLYIETAETGYYALKKGDFIHNNDSVPAGIEIKNDSIMFLTVKVSNNRISKYFYIFGFNNSSNIYVGYRDYNGFGSGEDFSFSDFAYKTRETKFTVQPKITATLAADDNSTNIPTTQWVNTAIAASGGGNMNYVGTPLSITPISDGATTPVIVVDNGAKQITATKGAVADYNGVFYLFNGTQWKAM